MSNKTPDESDKGWFHWLAECLDDGRKFGEAIEKFCKWGVEGVPYVWSSVSAWWYGEDKNPADPKKIPPASC